VNLGEKKKILKTISGGTLFGHKVKDKFNYYGIARGDVYIFSIEKSKYDSLIDVLVLKIKKVYKR
jgi:hypothetical protein